MRLSLRACFVSLTSVALLLFAMRVLGGPRSHAFIVAKVALELVVLSLLLHAPGSLLLRQRVAEGVTPRTRTLLAIPLSLLFYATVFVLLYSVSAPKWAYRVVVIPVVVAGLFLSLRDVFRKRELRCSATLVFALLATWCAVSFICVGMENPWKQVAGRLVAERGLHEMPVDNQLQFITADVFIRGKKPWAWHDGYWNWTMGDRPPLLAVITAVFAKTFLFFRKLRYFDYTLLGVFLNTLYLMPLVHLCRRILPDRCTAYCTALTLFLTPYLFLNSFYTWPKTFGVFLCLTALAVFARPARDVRTRKLLTQAALLGAVLGLSGLCHGGSFLSVPLVGSLIALFHLTRTSTKKYARIPPRLLASAAAVSVLACVLVYAPWSLYKAAHPEIQTNNLAAHYFPSRESYGHTLSLREWLDQTSISEQLTVRMAHVREVLSQSDFQGALHALFTGTLHQLNEQRWAVEFFHVISQVGEIRWALGALSFALLLTQGLRGRFRQVRSRESFLLARTAVVLVLAILSYLGNVFAKWTDTMPHTMPMLEVIVVMAALAALSFGASRLFGGLLLLIVLQRFLDFLIACTVKRNLPVDLFLLSLLASIFAMLTLALRIGSNTKALATLPNQNSVAPSLP